MGVFKLTINHLGEKALILQWPDDISPEILTDLLSFKNFLTENFNGRISEIVTTYNSLTLFFDGSHRDELEKMVRDAYHSFQGENLIKPVLWEIPVCYDEKFGIDLEEMSREINLSKEEIIHRHSSAVYIVYFIGFLPGFLYMGGMDPSIAFRRRSSPRAAVVKGAVGIAGRQTGVYPNQSPAGWNIIGNSPLSFFDPVAEPPCFVKPGDRIRFKPVSKKEHSKIQKEVNQGTYTIKHEQYEG